jgi:uncharacterized protein (DUF305 family)
LKILLSEAWLLALLLVVAFMMVACGGASDGQQGSGPSSEQESAESTSNGMSRMDHDQMDHGSTGMGSGEMVMENGKYADERFIDAMVPHHQGAIEMAQVASEKSENPRIKELAGNIIVAQKQEIEQMKQWRKKWYPQG